MHPIHFCLLAALALPAASPAGEPPADKPQFTLFHPTPRTLMRELTTDRPDATESPYTVDAGHLQVEMDLANFSFDRHNPDRTGTRVEAWSFGSVNFRLGLLNDVELQLIAEPWNTIRTSGRIGGVTRQSGFGDFTVRAKFNLWGNDGGRTAGAVMPFVKFPTSQDDLGSGEVEGGIILPFAASLSDSWGLGMMTEVDFNADADGRGRHAEWVNTFTVGCAVTGRFGAYLEFISTVSSERAAPWAGALGVGGTFAVSDDVQLDAGVNIGLTRSADDVNPFLGITWRF